LGQDSDSLAHGKLNPQLHANNLVNGLCTKQNDENRIEGQHGGLEENQKLVRAVVLRPGIYGILVVVIVVHVGIIVALVDQVKAHVGGVDEEKQVDEQHQRENSSKATLRRRQTNTN